MAKINNYVTIFSFILDARLTLVAIMANKMYKIRNRKTRFRGNQYTTTVTDQSTVAHNVTQTINNEKINCSLSKRKLKHTSETTNLAETECNSFYFFMHFKQLQRAFEKYASCQYCGAGLNLSQNEMKKMGFSLSFSIVCNDCGFEDQLFSSTDIKQNKPGINPQEIDIRSVKAFREIGRGRKAILTFTTIMNMPRPVNKNNFDAINDDVHMSGATESMKRATFEIKKTVNPSCKNDDLIHCVVSIDRSWQDKGFASLNGLVAVTSHDNSKVIDAVVLSTFCKGCQIWGKKERTIAYEQWNCTHNCQINHNGSSGFNLGSRCNRNLCLINYQMQLISFKISCG